MHMLAWRHATRGPSKISFFMRKHHLFDHKVKAEMILYFAFYDKYISKQGNTARRYHLDKGNSNLWSSNMEVKLYQ